MTKRSLTLILPLCAALAVACGSDGGIGPKSATPQPATQKLVPTRIEVAPESTAIMQGDEYRLTIDAWDQFGVKLPDPKDSLWADKATYVSSAPEVARVRSGGFVTAVAPGVVRITALLTFGDRTVTGSVVTKVDPATATSALLTAGEYGRWSPTTVTVKAGATVTWVIPAGVQVGTIWLNVWESYADTLKFTNGVATRTFPTPGVYFYGTGGGFMWDEEGGRIQVF